MPHVDDGILHAWLDGAIDAFEASGELPAGMTKADVVAHLSTCPDCRARLEAERDIRERAGLVLHDIALPRIETPPFATIAAVPTSRRTPRRVLPLSWAASVLLAVGAGWWGSAQWRAQTDTPAVHESASAAPAAGEGAPLDPASDVGLQAAPFAEIPPPPPASARREEADGSEARRADAETSRVAGELPQAPVAAAAAPVAARNGPEPSAAATGRLAVTDSGISAEPIRTDNRAELDRLAAPSLSTESRRPLGVQSAQVASDALRLTDAAGTIVYLAPNTEVRAFDAVLLRARSGQMRWRAVAPADDPGVAPLFVIDGASDPRIERGQHPESTIVRITQTLASGVPVELLVWRQEAIVMSEIVTTGAAAASRERAAESSRAAPAPAAPPPARADADVVASRTSSGSAVEKMVTTGASRVLPDGRRELVLRSLAAPVWMALRADLTDAELEDLARRLVLLEQR